MHLSEARIKANQANAKKSTGPKTPEGKRRSSANAVKHGLSSEVIVTEDAEAIGVRASEIDPAPAPAGGLDAWAAGQAAVMSFRIERCQESERAIRERIVGRAEVTWDEDRRLEATLLAQALGKRPEEISARLRETYHGVEWLLGRWAMLAYSADTQGIWTPEQSSLAFDLMGTPREFRAGNEPGTALDFHGKLQDSTPDQAAVARLEIDELLELRERLRPLDEAARARAMSDLAPDDDPELKRLRRYEASLQRRMQWALDLVERINPATEAASDEVPEPEPEPTDPPPADRPATPSPTRSCARAEKKRLKEEARREARRRKLDHRRA